MSDLSPQEMSVQGSAMVTHLHQQLTQAIGDIARLKGENAILEYRLAKSQKVPDATE